MTKKEYDDIVIDHVDSFLKRKGYSYNHILSGSCAAEIPTFRRLVTAYLHEELQYHNDEIARFFHRRQMPSGYYRYHADYLKVDKGYRALYEEIKQCLQPVKYALGL